MDSAVDSTHRRSLDSASHQSYFCTSVTQMPDHREVIVNRNCDSLQVYSSVTSLVLVKSIIKDIRDNPNLTSIVLINSKVRHRICKNPNLTSIVLINSEVAYSIRKNPNLTSVVLINSEIEWMHSNPNLKSTVLINSKVGWIYTNYKLILLILIYSRVACICDNPNLKYLTYLGNYCVDT